MSWRLRVSVATILRLPTAVLRSTVFSIAGLCAAHACLDCISRSGPRHIARSASIITIMR
jgi:hypothetical protein